MSDVPAHLSSSQIALLLDGVYGRARRGWPPELRHWQLVDHLGCHPEVQAAVWDLWQVELLITGQNLGETGGWLDFDFYEAVPVE